MNHAAGSEAQQLFQPLRTDSHLWPANPATNAVSFWVNRRQAFAGTAMVGSLPGYTGSGQVLPTTGGLVMGVANAAATVVNSDNVQLSWGVVGNNTDDLILITSARAGGSPRWIQQKFADLPLNQWVFCVANLGIFVAGAGSHTPLSGAIQTYADAQLTSTVTPTSSNSSGGSWASRQWNIDPVVARFAIGDPTNANIAVRGVGNGALLDIAQVAFHTRELTRVEIFGLYESMLYGG